MGFISKLKEGLAKTIKQFDAVFLSFTGTDDAFFDDLEETLITADLGAANAGSIVDALRETVKKESLREADAVKAALTGILTERLGSDGSALKLTTRPSVVLVIGVNGVGKTTTIGKLAFKFAGEGKKVLLCAGDTFRAAAGEQLSIWAKRAGSDIVRRDEGADPASVIFDGINAAKARGTDIVICDTAGRLHNKKNLMSELEKINRVIDKRYPEAQKQTFIVLDATTGQNALMQAKMFSEILDLSGIILTKLDGTAKGGIVISIINELKIPICYVGVGEGIDDLVRFDATKFVDNLFE